MIITTHGLNILLAPIVAIIFALDLYICLVGVRLIAGRLPGSLAARVRFGSQTLTDPAWAAINHRLATWRRRPVPPWASWLVMVLVCLIARHLLVLVLISLSRST